MTAKLKIEDIKEEVEKSGYKMISDRYSGTHCKLSLACKIHGPFELSLTSIRLGFKCRRCTPNSKQKIPYQEVVEAFRNRNFTLKTVESEYKNVRQNLDTICPNGHTYWVSYNLFVKRGFGCPICSGNAPHTLESAREIFSKEGYTLKSTEYVKNTKPLHVVCPNGHDWEEVTLNNFTDKKTRCPHCSGIVFKHTLEFVKQYVESQDYKLLSNTYKNANTKLDLLCSSGHVYKVRFGAFYSDTDRCPKCSKAGISKIEMDFMSWTQTIRPDAEKLVIKLGGRKKRDIDIFIPSEKFGIELNGTYWHSEAVFDLKDRLRTFEKMNLCKDRGVEFMVFFCYEWYSKESQIKGLVSSRLGEFDKHISSKLCTVETLNKEEAIEFIAKNSVIDCKKSSHFIGLKYDGEIVSVIFGSTRGHYRKIGLMEGISTKIGINILDGDVLLFNRFMGWCKSISVEKVISWTDNRFGLGSTHQKLGFRKTREYAPDYFYCRNGKPVPKSKCTKDMLILWGGHGETVRDVAWSIKYYRVWDCGKIKWSHGIT